MKTQSMRRSRGFTLVELLVVISIILVLAAAGFAAGRAAMEKARKVTALTAATSLEQAVNSFYSDYGSLPDDGTDQQDGGAEFQTDRGPGVEILNVLLGLDETSQTPRNPKKVRYLNLKEGKGKKNGLIFDYNGKSVTGLYDPWGNGYVMVLDTAYNERLSFRIGGTQQNLNGRRVAVYSIGADGKPGTPDDVKTW